MPLGDIPSLWRVIYHKGRRGYALSLKAHRKAARTDKGSDLVACDHFQCFDILWEAC